MYSEEILDEIQQKIYEAFVSQDPELFDVIFEINGKKIYADKLRLSIVSPTFKVMLSDRWYSNENEPIQIKEYKYEDFKELLNFIYSGKCNITDSNIFTILDMAEFYQIKHLKEACEKYLSTMKIDFKNVLTVFETSNKYTLAKMKFLVQTFIFENLTNMIHSGTFLKADKTLIEEIISENFIVTKSEEFFKAVYQWSEYQALKKQKESNDDINFNKNDAIKTEMAPFLPYFNLKEMNQIFLKHFLDKKRFLFSGNELSDILDFTDNQCVKVKITNSLGQSIAGDLSVNLDAVEIIKSLQNRLSNFPIWWRTNSKIPSYSSPLIFNSTVEWYLIYFSNGDIGVKKSSRCRFNEYLIAEMSIINSLEFVYTNMCKIEIE